VVWVMGRGVELELFNACIVAHAWKPKHWGTRPPYLAPQIQFQPPPPPPPPPQKHPRTDEERGAGRVVVDVGDLHKGLGARGGWWLVSWLVGWYEGAPRRLALGAGLALASPLFQTLVEAMQGMCMRGQAAASMYTARPSLQARVLVRPTTDLRLHRRHRGRARLRAEPAGLVPWANGAGACAVLCGCGGGVEEGLVWRRRWALEDGIRGQCVSGGGGGGGV
jgi:hypothetical protein